jgi:hypothetical protein
MTSERARREATQDAEGWSAVDVPTAEGRSLVQFADGLRELGVEDAEVESTLEILRDPTESDPELVRRTLLDVGASRKGADNAIREWKEIELRSAVPRGAHLDWGSDPNLTYTERLHDEYAIYKRRRGDRLRDAILEAFGFDVPVGSPHFEEARLPILVLAAPAVAGAKVEWTGTESAEAGGGFELTLFGSGLGASRTISIESSRKEVCEDGEARMVRLSVPVLAQPLGRRRKGRVEAVRYKRELAQAGPGVPLRRFLVDELKHSDLAALAGPAADEEDRSNEKNPVELTDSAAVVGKRTLTVGVKYKDVETTLSGSLEGKQSYDVTSTLPGGYRYRRYYPEGAFGLMWDLRGS